MCRSGLSLLILAVSIQTTFAQSRRFVASDSSKKRIAIIDEAGKTEWERKIGPLHDFHMLDNGNLLMQDSWTHVFEIDPKSDEIVWEYDAQSNGNEGKRVQVHAFQRLANGLTMIAESGSSRIIEVDRHGKIAREIALKVDHPHFHTDTRLARKLDNGNYLVCHEGDGFHSRIQRRRKSGLGLRRAAVRS